MIRVKIELVPFGREADAKTIETIYIGNVGTVERTDSDALCAYDAWNGIDPRGDRENRAEPHVKVEHWRAAGAIELVRKVLEKLV